MTDFYGDFRSLFPSALNPTDDSGENWDIGQAHMYIERKMLIVCSTSMRDRAGAVFTQDYREGFDRSGNKHLSTTEENNLRLRLTRVSQKSQIQGLSMSLWAIKTRETL